MARNAMPTEVPASTRLSERRVAAALDALARATAALVEDGGLDEALAEIVEALSAATGAKLVAARVADPSGRLQVRAVSAVSPTLAAELEGSSIGVDELQDDPWLEGLEAVPGALRRIAARAGAHAVLLVPVSVAGRSLGSLELMRAGPFGAVDRSLGLLAAAHTGLLLHATGAGSSSRSSAGILELAGHALAAGADELGAAEHVARLSAEATGAACCLIWRATEADRVEPLASFGTAPSEHELARAEELAARALEANSAGTIEPAAEGLPAASRFAATLQLGQPPFGVLQLFFTAELPPSGTELDAMTVYAVRAANLLRSSERVQEQTAALERTEALLGIVAQAISELSLAHTLETALDRVAELLRADRLAVYLVEDGGLVSAASRGLEGPHLIVAERLLELALGRFRARGFLYVEDVAADSRLAAVGEPAAEAGIDAALVVPLVVQDELIGLVAVYPPRGRLLTEDEQLVRALAGQLAVAVQNARLHEHAKQLGRELEHALASERQSAQQLRSLYEISHSFTHSLSLDTTLHAVARAIVDLLDADAAVIRMHDARREFLVPRAVHVVESRMDDVLRAILNQSQPVAKLPGRRKLYKGEPFVLDAEIARRLGTANELLAPFLERGSTAVVLPIGTPAEMVATLTLLSLDPARPLREDRLEPALSIAGQAALAIENARFYQQQKTFSDTMQRSLLPSAPPEVPGLALGAVYESSARLDVGGDVYDFMVLEDGRLAIVLGDVTGHGLEAAADMAMAKFVFRSLAREHPEPGDFLAHANEVVAEEIASGKFLTMVCVTFAVSADEVVCAGAGHPPPRLVTADGRVEPLEVSGLALGIEPGQHYEEVRAAVPAGAAVVLFTDGVIEARRGNDFYGFDRLDRVLAEGSALPAEELARAVVEDCKEWSGGELADDCAVVVVKRTLPKEAVQRP